MTDGRFLTLGDVAEVLNISASQTYALVRNNELKAIKIGGRGQWRVEHEQLENYIGRMYDQTERFIAEHPFSRPTQQSRSVRWQPSSAARGSAHADQPSADPPGLADRRRRPARLGVTANRNQPRQRHQLHLANFGAPAQLPGRVDSDLDEVRSHPVNGAVQGEAVLQMHPNPRSIPGDAA